MRTPILLVLLASAALAQEVVPLYPGTPPGGPDETYPEKQYFGKAWNTEIVANVTRPSLTVFKPAPGTANDSGIVVWPDGGFMALSITSEGTDVAKFLAAKGMTAFVLKYRLARSGEDASQEFSTLYADRQKFAQTVGAAIPLAVADGLAAMVHVRKHAAEWNLSPDRIGIVGFSAGSTLAAAAGLRYTPEGRPAFVAPIYAAASRFRTD